MEPEKKTMGALGKMKALMKTEWGTKKELQMKLMVNPKTNTVVFAEVGKGIVDLLFGLMSLRLRSVVRLLSEHQKTEDFGCLQEIYESARNLPSPYVEAPEMLTPFRRAIETVAVSSTANTKWPYLLAEENEADSCYHKEKTTISFCGKCKKMASIQTVGDCPECHQAYSANDVRLLFKGKPKGYVKKLAYILTDDLQVFPLTGITVLLSVLHKNNVSDISKLEEKHVKFTFEQVLMLLRAILMQSRNVLTELFLKVPMEIVGTPAGKKIVPVNMKLDNTMEEDA